MGNATGHAERCATAIALLALGSEVSPSTEASSQAECTCDGLCWALCRDAPSISIFFVVVFFFSPKYQPSV